MRQQTLNSFKVTNWFTLGAEVLKAFVVLQERLEVIGIVEHLQAVLQHRGGRGKPGNSLFDYGKKRFSLKKFKFQKTTVLKRRRGNGD